MGCTALEKVVLYFPNTTSTTGIDSNFDVFRDCSSLKTVEFYNGKNKQIGFKYISDGTFVGCASLEELPMIANTAYVEGTPFAGTNFEVLHFKTVMYYRDGANFAGMKNLKDVFIKKVSNTKFYAETFTNLETDVNFYFYDMTYEQAVKAAGNDAWFTNADKKAHFYFKDTMPEDVEIPGQEEDSGGSGGGTTPVNPGLRPL